MRRAFDSFTCLSETEVALACAAASPICSDLTSMSIDELWSLHEEISAILSARILQEKRELEKRLAILNRGVTYEKLDELGSVQWPCNDAFPEGTPVMHRAGFARGKGLFVLTEYVATDEKVGPRFPLLLTT